MQPLFKKRRRYPDLTSRAPQLPAFAARSLDDEDDFALSSGTAFSPSYASHNLHAVEFCESLLSLHERLEDVDEGRFAREGSSEVFEIARDRVGGNLTVTRFRKKVKDLGAAKRQAKEDVANEITKRKADIAGLENEVAILQYYIEESDPDAAEQLGVQLTHLLLMLGKHRRFVRELEAKREVKMTLEVERVSTRVVIQKNETVVVEKEATMVPVRDVCIYVMGGIGDERNIEKYDASKDRWESVGAMRSLHAFAPTVVLGDEICVIGGGRYACTSQLSVERFNIKTGSWSVGVPLKAAWKGCVAGAIDGKMYVAGGDDRMEMSCPRAYAAGAVLGGSLYVLGGVGNEGEIWRTAERYNPATDTWEPLPPMKHKRAGGAAAVLDGLLYVLGGYCDATLSSVERFDPRLNRWEDVPAMNSARAGLVAVEMKGSIYAIGGGCGRNVSTLSSVERFDVSTSRWEFVSPMSTPRAYPSAAVALEPMPALPLLPNLKSENASNLAESSQKISRENPAILRTEGSLTRNSCAQS
eukprot:g61873.t1